MFSTYYDKLKVIKQKPMLIYVLCCVMLLPLSVFAVYYFRVLYEPDWMGQLQYTAYLYVALVALFSAMFFLMKKYKKHPELVLSAVILILGILYALATPINQVPDENVHFLRAQTMAQGQFGFDENHEFPRDSMVLMESFPNMFLNGHRYSIAQKYEQYFDNMADESHTPPQISIIIFQIFAYIPQTLGIAFARLIGCGAMGAYYFSRVFNALFFSVCAYFSFRFAPRFKLLLFTVMCIPITAYSIGSVNSDSVLFALMFLAISCVLSEKFDAKKLVIFAICTAILIVSKASYVVMLPLVLFVPKQNYCVKLKNRNISKVVIFVFSSIIAVIIYQFMALYVQLFSNYGVIERTMDSTNPAQQLTFILQNPLRYMVTFVDVLIDNSFFMFSAGLFGWLDANLNIISNLTVILVMVIIFKHSGVFKKEDKSIVFGFALNAILTYGVVVTGLYLSWSPVGHIDIIGLQMRYFIPAFVGFVIVAGFYFKKFAKEKVPQNTDISSICALFGLNIIAIILQFSMYYMR